MLRWPYRVGQSFHCLETNVSAGMGTASKETRGLYREGYSDGASRVTGLGSLLDLPEALGANHDGKAPVPVDHPDPSPDHLRPARRTDKVLPSQKAGPPLPLRPQVPVAFAPATGADSSRSMYTRIPHLLSPRGRLLTSSRPNYLHPASTLSANKRFGERPHEVRRTKNAC